MLRKYILSISIICLISSCASSGQVSDQFFNNEVWGTYTQNAANQLDDISPKTHPHIKGVSIIILCNDLEPSSGDFKFQEMIGNRLEQLDSWDWNCYLMVWVAHAKRDGKWSRRTPQWLFEEEGVPLVTMSDDDDEYPYYLDSTYKHYYHRMLSEMGKYLLSLPENLRKRVLFIQCAEGSTGDESPYKNNTPVNSSYNISDDQWGVFRRETWAACIDGVVENGLQKVPVLVNASEKFGDEVGYLFSIAKGPVGIKEGGLTHGYHANYAKNKVEDLLKIRKRAEEAGIEFFIRGEMNEWERHWISLNTPQGLYWSALLVAHSGINMWNLQYRAAEGETHIDAMNICNKYCGAIKPRESKSAFIALRRGLDASDTESFPEDIFGSADQKNKDRYEAIEAEFSAYGAKNENPDDALGGGMKSRRREGRNDIGWEITRGNWERHIQQIDENETSVGWWQIDESIYGRFARGFDPSSGKNSMYFDLDDQFFGSDFLKGSQDVVVEVTYRDDDPGSWKLVYDATDGSMKTAMEITNTGSGGWKKEKVQLNDAYLGNRGQKGADFILCNTGNTNCRFHMISVDKTR